MRDLLYFVIGVLLALICIFFDGSTVMAQSDYYGRTTQRTTCLPNGAIPGALDVATCSKRHRANARA